MTQDLVIKIGGGVAGRRECGGMKTCKGTTKLGKPCPSSACPPDWDYCVGHDPARGGNPNPTVVVTTRCAGVNKRGEPCEKGVKGPMPTGPVYCPLHDPAKADAREEAVARRAIELEAEARAGKAREEERKAFQEAEAALLRKWNLRDAARKAAADAETAEARARQARADAEAAERRAAMMPTRDQEASLLRRAAATMDGDPTPEQAAIARAQWELARELRLRREREEVPAPPPKKKKGEDGDGKPQEVELGNVVKGKPKRQPVTG